jgi:NAD(P)-dependent dehydrogenase (short-subunit alcohol dehydrogenase family)
MGNLDGRVAVITGAGRGLGREHALLFAKEGAKIVVNDLGGGTGGEGEDATPAQQVVDEIKALGGEAVANYDNCADFEGAKRMIDTAVETFGDLHVLVNNAGILRDRIIFNMTEEEWDAVINVHLKGHFCPAHHAAGYWRAQSKEGKEVKANIINTTSVAGLFFNPGQANYAAAKAGIASFTIVLAKELGRYGVRVNCIGPYARTRLTLQTPGLDQMVKAPDDPDAFDIWDPANVSPLVAYLATEDCPWNGTVFHTFAGQVGIFHGWTLGETVEQGHRFSVDELKSSLADLAAQSAGKLGSAALDDAIMGQAIMKAANAK